jgi:hypothetical protein
MNQTISAHLESVRDCLPRYGSKTAADFRAFEAALARANAIYNEMPAEVVLHGFTRIEPDNYGEDLRHSLLGVIEEERSYLQAIRTIYGYKLNEMAAGILEGFIPNPIDQNPWAHWRSPMDMMRQGWSTSLFHAAQQWSTRSS